MRKTAAILFCMMVTIASPFVRGVVADEVILATGERFTSSKVWEEGDKVLFDMQGLIVNVNKKDVAAIVRGALQTQPSAAVAGPSVPDRWTDAPAPSNSPSDETPPPPRTPADAKDKNHHSNPKIRGIGFDGLVWMMPPGDIAGIARIGTDPAYGGIDQYWRPDGNLTLGDVFLDGLVLGFWQNRLYTIMVWVNGKPAYNRLQSAVFERYGSGRRNVKGLERYIWIDGSTDRMLEFDPQRNTGIFWMRSRDLDQQVKRMYPGR
jgi:hypothetical protein